MRRWLGRLARQRHHDGETAARGVLQAEAAPDGLDEPPGHRQAEPDAAPPGVAEPLERGEDPVSVLLGHPRPPVDHQQVARLPHLASLDADAPPRR